MIRILILMAVATLFGGCKNEIKKEENPAKSYAIEAELQSTANLYAGKLYRIDSLPSKFIKTRPVDVWVPEHYSSEKKYSVLYMHDGQMLFDASNTWNQQEWKVDEWASQLMADEKTKDFIVVAIHNIPEIRWQDLFPEKAMDFVSDEDIKAIEEASGRSEYKLNGDNYLKFIVEELKPLIDDSYSVYQDRAHTFVMGSSMGGLMSMYAISEYPTVFGGAAALSTHWPGAMPMDNNPLPEAIFQYMEQQLPKAGEHTLYFDYGNQTLDEHYPQYAPRVDDILKAKGYTEQNAKNLFFEGTDHSEKSWNKRLDQPLRFLLGN